MEKEQPHRSSLLVVKIEDEESFGKYACQIRDRFRSTTHTISHRRTGLEIFFGGGWTRIRPICAEATRTSRGVLGMLPGKILKNRVSLMPSPAFWCEFLCIDK